MQCRAMVSDLCKSGHATERECDIGAVKCSVKLSANCPAGLHASERLCGEAAPESCPSCVNAAPTAVGEAATLTNGTVKEKKALGYGALRANTLPHNTQQANLQKKQVVPVLVSNAKKSVTGDPQVPAVTASAPLVTASTATNATTGASVAPASVNETGVGDSTLNPTSAVVKNEEVRETKKIYKTAVPTANLPSALGPAATASTTESPPATAAAGATSATPSPPVVDSLQEWVGALKPRPRVKPVSVAVSTASAAPPVCPAAAATTSSTPHLQGASPKKPNEKKPKEKRPLTWATKPSSITTDSTTSTVVASVAAIAPTIATSTTSTVTAAPTSVTATARSPSRLQTNKTAQPPSPDEMILDDFEDFKEIENPYMVEKAAAALPAKDPARTSGTTTATTSKRPSQEVMILDDFEEGLEDFQEAKKPRREEPTFSGVLSSVARTTPKRPTSSTGTETFTSVGRGMRRRSSRAGTPKSTTSEPISPEVVPVSAAKRRRTGRSALLAEDDSDIEVVSAPPASTVIRLLNAPAGPAQVRLSEMLQLSVVELWPELLSLPALTAPDDADPPAEHFSHLAVRAVTLLAEEHEERAGPDFDPIGPLVDRFTDLNDFCEAGCVDNIFVYFVSAVLKYVRFVFLSKEPDATSQQTAKNNAAAFVWLLQSNARQELFQQIPSVWKGEASRFKPNESSSALQTLPPSQKARDPNCAAERWWFCKNKFLSSPKTRRADSKSPPRTTPAESIDILLKMTGMEGVKRSIIGMYERLQIAKLQGGAEVGTTFNLRLDGNPGTGKTTVARLYASFLVEVGILPEKADIHETSGSKLISDGVKGLTKTLEDMKENAEGGVMFVDETYQLNPMPGSPGGQVLDFILPLAEKMDGPYGKIVWIFSGYTNRMDKLFEHNPGLPSRFHHRLLFEDYTDAELLSIMNSLMQNGGKDVGAAPKKAPAPPAPKAKKASVQVPAGAQNGGFNAMRMPQANGGYDMYGRLVSKPDQKDQWGNTWTFSPTTYMWTDDFNNTAAGGANNLGTAANMLVNQDDNLFWLFDTKKKLWHHHNDPNKTQAWYPGSPPPPPPPAPVVPVKPFVADPKWVRVAITRLGRSRGKVGFGNARAVRILFEQTHTRQTMRLSALERQNMTGFRAANKMEFVRDDLLGPKADAESLKNSCEAWQKLEAMTGLKEVKESLEKLVELAVINSDLEDDEQPVRGVVLNRIFLGNPGTGKTTVAALYGQILCHLGLLSKGELVLKNSSDFVGGALGSSESQTRGILAASEGCVLVIDEAYSLNPSPNNKNGGGLSGMDPFKTAVVDTIVEQVQGRPGEDRAVVMLGYRKEMEDFLAKANPGLSRRFQMENAFEFADYSDDQLLTILLQMCKTEHLRISDQVAAYAVKQLARARSLPNFGNAGALNNFLSVAKLNMGGRRELVKSDFHVGGVVPVKIEESTIFDDLVGCANVLAELKSMQSSIKFAQKRGKDIKSTFESSFLFVGAPGTGKTTVARKMGVMFHSLGLLPTPDVMEIKAADLATGFVGQSAHKASEVMSRAKGKVLFIDEAYQLNPAKGGQFMQEAVDAMVKALTSEELQGQLVVILAGYEKEIDDMLRATNPGLRSRFSKKIVFEDFTPEDVASILRADLAAESVTLTAEADEALGWVAEDLCKIHEFSNGRDAKTLVKRIMKSYAERVVDKDSEPDLEVEDLRLALESMQKTRLRDAKTAATGQPSPTLPVMPQQFQFQNQFVPPPPPVVTEIVKKMDVEEEVEQEAEEEMEGEKQEEEEGFSPGSTAFLRTLQDLLDQQGLNSQAGVRRLAHMGLNDPYMQQLARQIADLTGTDVSGALGLLREWQVKQSSVEDKEAEMEEEKARAKLEKRKAILPIWRCAVCGAANMPYIVCYVSPYICEYREVDVM